MPTTTAAASLHFLPSSNLHPHLLRKITKTPARSRPLRNPVLVSAAKKKDSDGGFNNGKGEKIPRFGTPFPNGSSDTDSPVPWDQLPINEFNSLQDSTYFSWASENLLHYSLKIGAVTTLCTALGWPVVSLSFNPESELWKCGVGALSAGLMAATLAALRLYLGWAHVGNRLFSVSVEYEETGWYDGQTWVKPPEVLARDRLVGSYTVKPALNRVKVTLIGLAVSLSVCTILLFSLPEARSEIPRLPDQQEQQTLRSFTSDYNEESVRNYEPDACFSDTTSS